MNTCTDYSSDVVDLVAQKIVLAASVLLYDADTLFEHNKQPEPSTDIKRMLDDLAKHAQAMSREIEQRISAEDEVFPCSCGRAADVHRNTTSGISIRCHRCIKSVSSMNDPSNTIKIWNKYLRFEAKSNEC